jgi:uncharacterized protein (DUF849 family)
MVATWLVSSFGNDCVGCGLAEAAIKRGGHVQVGLEPYTESGVTGARVPTNLELGLEMVALAEKYDRPIATPAQAAQVLNLPTCSTNVPREPERTPDSDAGRPG